MSTETSHYVTLRSSVSVADLRTAKYNGVDHLVVPVIGLVGDKVIHSANAKNPEYIPADIISIAPMGWNNRPCVPDHPKNEDGQYVSANSIGVLESRKFGQLFDATFDDGKLKFNAYLSPLEAEKVGKDAIDIITRFNNGEVVEVSTGAFITVKEESGVTVDGKEYSGVWTSITPDHLAFLNSKSEGACNVEMGCGAPRINEKTRLLDGKSVGVKVNEDKKETEMEIGKKESNQVGLLQRILSALRIDKLFEDGDSDYDFRSSIETALREVVSNLDWIYRIFPDNNAVIYYTYDYNNSQTKLYRRTYNIDSNKVVTINDDAVEVKEVEKFEPVEEMSANEKTTEKTTTKNKTNKTTESKVKAEGNVVNLSVNGSDSECTCKGEKIMANVASEKFDRKKVVERLTKLEKFKASVKALEAMDDEGLKAVDEKFPDDTENKEDANKGEEKKVEKVEKVEAKSEADNEQVITNSKPTDKSVNSATLTKPLTEEEYLASAPPSIRDMVNRHKEAENEYRTELITNLKSSQDTYTEAELREMSTSQLEKTTKLLGKSTVAQAPIRSYVGRGFPTSAKEDNNDVYVNYPKPYDIAINSGKEQSQSKSQSKSN